MTLSNVFDHAIPSVYTSTLTQLSQDSTSCFLVAVIIQSDIVD